MNSTHSKEEEVWSNLADIAQVCADRLTKKKQKDSWTQKQYPGTEIPIRIDMKKVYTYSSGQDMLRDIPAGLQFDAKIKLANSSKWVYFTSDQVQDYLDRVILGEE